MRIGHEANRGQLFQYCFFLIKTPRHCLTRTKATMRSHPTEPSVFCMCRPEGERRPGRVDALAQGGPDASLEAVHRAQLARTARRLRHLPLGPCSVENGWGK